MQCVPTRPFSEHMSHFFYTHTVKRVMHHWTWACVAAAFTLPPTAQAFTKTPIQSVFATARASRQQPAPGLGPVDLRRALSDAGNDVSMTTARRLIRRYGDVNGRIRLRALDRMIRREPTMTGSRILLSVDRDGTTFRPTRYGFARFGRAGSVTPLRLMHYAVGVTSIAVGTFDMFSFVAAGALPEMSFDVAEQHALLHTAAAVLALPRFAYQKGGPAWKMGLASARDANMWPSFLVCAWYTAALHTDLVWPHEDVVATFQDPAFLALSHIVAFSVIYGIARSAEEDVREHDVSWTATTSAILMVLPIMFDVCRALYFCIAPDMYHTLIEMCYPDFTRLQVGMFLGAMYGGNVLCALASAKHYRAVSDEGISRVGTVLNIVYALLPVWACFDYVADGRFLGLYLQALGLTT